MMKLAKRAAALVLAAVLALSLTACSPKEVASNLILKTADLLGLREEGSDDDEADENSGVAWFTPEEALVKSTEPWFVKHVYAKLLEKMKTI